MKIDISSYNQKVRFLIVIMTSVIIGFNYGKLFKAYKNKKEEVQIEAQVDLKSLKLTFEVDKEGTSELIGKIDVRTNVETLGDLLYKVSEMPGWTIVLNGTKSSTSSRILSGVNGYETVTEEIDPWWVYSSVTADVPKEVSKEDYNKGNNFLVDKQLIKDGDEFSFKFKLFDGEMWYWNM